MKFTLPPALRLGLKLDWGVLASRLSLLALAAILSLLTQHGLPHTTKEALAVGAGGLAAAIAALPSALLAAGLRRPVSPQFASLCQWLGQTLAQLGQMLPRPGVSTADVQAAVSAEMRVITPQLIRLAADEAEKRWNRTNMEGFVPGELGQKAEDGPDTPDAPAEAPAPATEAKTEAVAVVADNKETTVVNKETTVVADAAVVQSDSIAQTGGNQ